MESAKYIIDNYFYPDCYNQWLEMKRKVIKLTNDYNRNKKQLESLANFYAVINQLYYDVDDINRLYNIINTHVGIVLNNGNVDTEKVIDYMVVQELSMQIVENEIGLAKALLAFHTWVTGLIAFSILMIKYRAKKLKTIIEILIRQLKVAEKQLKVAKLKTAVNVTVGVITFLLPPLGLLTRIGLAGGQLVLDLTTDGPQKSMAKEVGDKTSPAGEIIAEEISKVKKYSEGSKLIAKDAGRLFSAAGYYYSVDEVLIGCRNVDTIKHKLKQARYYYNALMLEYKKMKPSLKRYKMQLVTVNYNYKKTMYSIGTLRSKKYDIIRKSRLVLQ